MAAPSCDIEAETATEAETDMDMTEADYDTDDGAGTEVMPSQILQERKRRLRELEVLLHAQAAQASEPELRKALGHVEAAIANAQFFSSLAEPTTMAPPDRHVALATEGANLVKPPGGTQASFVPKLHLPGSQSSPSAFAPAPQSARAAIGSDAVGSGATVKPPLSARGSSRDTGRRSGSGPVRNSVGVNPWFSLSQTGGYPTGQAPASGSTPASPRISQSTPRSSLQSPRSRGSFGSQLAVRRSKLSVVAAAARSPKTASLCSQLEELIVAVPTRSVDTLESGFVKLLGELNVLEQRFASQTKVCEELRAKLARSPATGVSHQRLRESEETYRAHIERLAARDRCKAVRIQESMQLTGKETQLLDETAALQDERIKVFQHQRAARQSISFTEAKDRGQLAALRVQIEEKKAVQRHLEGLMPAARRVYEEQQALRRRIEKLRC